MKLCQWVWGLTLATTGTLSLGAQALPAEQVPAQPVPAQPVLVASESLPAGAMLFPELYAGTHSALLPALGLPITPAIRQTMLAPAPAPPLDPHLSGKDRLTLFWNRTYASPGAFAGLSAGAFVDQLRHTPAKWDGDGSGYTRRFASGYGQLATRNVIHDGMAGLTGLDPRYAVCQCSGVFRRSGHALKMSFAANRQDGRLMLDVPQLAGAYGSGMISTYWYPHHLYSPVVQGVQFGHEQMGEIALSNLVQEFAPSLQRALHLHQLTARSHTHDEEEE